MNNDPEPQATNRKDSDPEDARLEDSDFEDSDLEARIQQVLDDYRPTLYMDGGDVELLRVDSQGIAHVKMLGACIDCPISLLTMKLGIQRLLKENFAEVRGINAITDVDIAALYNRSA